MYDIKQHTGFLRHLVLREGVHTGQLLVNLVIAPKHFESVPAHSSIREMLKQDFCKDPVLQEQVTSLVVTENNGLADIVKSQDAKTETLRGDGHYFEEIILNVQEETSSTRRRVSPFSFFQTNTLGAELLFSTAVAMAGAIKGNIIDLYCGSGTIGLSFLKAGLGSKVKGIEIVEDAVKDAYFSAKINGLEERSDFYAGKAEQLLQQGVIDSDFFVGNDLVIVDPPREGLHPDVVNFLNTLKQQYSYKLLYISCNPLTLARDIELLQAGHPRTIESIQPVDMFPHTQHIECIGVLT